MFARLTLMIAILFPIPTLGMAGVIVDVFAFEASHETSISASLGGDETPESESPKRLQEHRELAGLSSSSVITTSSSSTAIHGSTAFLFKPMTLLESKYGFTEWQFVPDSPVFKIPRVPIFKSARR